MTVDHAPQASRRRPGLVERAEERVRMPVRGVRSSLQSYLSDARVLLIEDDPDMVDVVRLLLERAGASVSHAGDGREGLDRFKAERFDIVLLDIMLPSLDGHAVCRGIRAVSQLPIVILTAKGETPDVVEGLQLGADDYVTKPFEGTELVARMEAILRRARPEHDGTPMTAGDLMLDPSACKAWKQGRELSLTTTEFRLLQELMRRRGEVLSRDELVRRAWGYEYLGDTRLVDMAVLRLREKVEDDRHTPERITTVRGAGYRFDSPAALGMDPLAPGPGAR